jgi:hypothetical protein
VSAGARRLAVAVVAIAALAGARTARAYPQFQLSTGADRCQACHYSPAGGGLINDYGRDEAGDTISGTGDGRFLYGKWAPPDWIQLGLDLRGATGVKDWFGPQLTKDRTTGDVPYGLLFPMQSDIYSRFGHDKGLSFTLTLGARYSARPGGWVEDILASREHYVMYQGDDWYVRAGRFFPIFGIRSQDHTIYVRKFQDLGLLQEPYGIGYGRFFASSELHVGVFGPDPAPILGDAPDDFGMAAYYEARVHDDQAAWAVQTRVMGGPDERRATLGGVGKWWIPSHKAMLLGELDVTEQTFPQGGPARTQIAGYLGATYMRLPGWMVGADLQTWKPDLTLTGDSRTGESINVQWFPRAHWEVHLLTRLEQQALRFGHPELLTLLQLHYYL